MTKNRIKVLKDAGSLFGLAFISAIAILSLSSLSRSRLIEAEEVRDLLLKNRENLLLTRNRLNIAEGESTVDISAITWNSIDPDTELQRKIVTAATLSEVSLLSFGPGISSADWGGNTFAVELELHSTNLQLLEFLKKLEELSPPVSISSLVIRQGAGTTGESREPLINVRVTVWGINREDFSDADSRN